MVEMNHALEQFHLKLNDAIGTDKQPSVPQFVRAIDGISKDYVKRLDDALSRKTGRSSSDESEKATGAFRLPSPLDLPSGDDDQDYRDEDNEGIDDEKGSDEDEDKGIYLVGGYEVVIDSD